MQTTPAARKLAASTASFTRSWRIRSLLQQNESEVKMLPLPRAISSLCVSCLYLLDSESRWRLSTVIAFTALATGARRTCSPQSHPRCPKCHAGLHVLTRGRQPLETGKSDAQRKATLTLVFLYACIQETRTMSPHSSLAGTMPAVNKVGSAAMLKCTPMKIH